MTAESLGLLAALYVLTGLTIAFGHYYFQPSKEAPQRKPLGKLWAYTYGCLCFATPYAIFLAYLTEYTAIAIGAGFLAVAGSVTYFTNYIDTQAKREKANHDQERRREIESPVIGWDDLDGD